MPKSKTNRGAAKRFKITNGGKGLKHRRATRNHILRKRTTKAKRQLRSNVHVTECDVLSVRRLLCLK